MNDDTMAKDKRSEAWLALTGAIRFVVTLSVLIAVTFLAVKVLVMGLTFLPIWLAIALPGVAIFVVLDVVQRLGHLVRSCL